MAADPASMTTMEPKAAPAESPAYAVTGDIAPSDTPQRPFPSTSRKHVWYITGPAGCGKTTAAVTVAQTYGLPYLEGDSFHPPSNVAKMAAGQPLTDEDRWSWLKSIREAAIARLDSAKGVVVTCSALKKIYRDSLREAETAKHQVHFLYLALSPEELVRRVEARVGHYMKAEMVASQLATLQEPDEQERGRDTVVVDASKDFDKVKEEVLEAFESAMAKSQ